MKTVKGLLGWLTKNEEQWSKTFAWCNVNKILTDEEICHIRQYFMRHKQIVFAVIINNINELRPQRTWGDLPEWFRSNTAYHFFAQAENAFVFVSCIDDDETRETLFKSIQEIEDEAKCSCYYYTRLKITGSF